MKARSKTRPSRVGHAHPQVLARNPGSDDADFPRGWIQPDGKFLATRNHWDAISEWLGRPGAGDPDLGERNAHLAYAKGWISLGHGGAMNAIAHETVFEVSGHPAALTLRKMVAKIPHFILRIERQQGKLDARTGRHDNFDVQEFDLNLFIKRGKLRRAEG